MYKIDNIYQKAKIKNLEQSLEFQKYDVKEKKKEKKEKKRTNKNKQGRENYKENIGTELITNTKKQKLKIQSRVWNFKNTTLKKKRRRRRKIKRENKQTNKNNVAKIIKKIQVQN